MRARLAALGAERRAGAHLPLGGARAAPPLRAGRGRPDPPVEGARCCGRSRTGCRARTASVPPATSRPRSSGRRTAASRPQRYRAALGDHEPPIPPDLMLRVYRAYEERKAAAGAIDFEDLLERAVRLYETDAGAVADFRARYRAFTVDEYQDVNLLQQSLLERWLGDRDDLCVVGDDYQSIYGFTGASPEHLLALPRGSGAHGRPARGELPLDAAGARAREPARAEARRRGEAAARRRARTGPSRSCAGSAIPASEGAFVVERIRALHGEGSRSRRSRSSAARTRARPTSRRRCTRRGSRSRARRCSARDGARGLLKRLRGAERPGGRGGASGRRASSAGSRSRRTGSASASRRGRTTSPASSRSRTSARRGRRCRSSWPSSRRASARRRRHAASTCSRSTARRGSSWTRSSCRGSRRSELPPHAAAATIEEERRLLYVGLTRARRHLALTWSGKPSRFLAELGVERPAPAAEAASRSSRTRPSSRR